MIKWDDNIWLMTPNELAQLPDGTELVCINGQTVVKGIDNIDDDTRGGYLAYGVTNIDTHPQSKLFTEFLLKT